jgi:hypothetical protein
LCDQQVWHFPKPQALGFIPVRVDGVTRLKPGFGWGEPYERLVDAYIETTTVGGEAITLIDLAFYLLGQNYNLEFTDLRHILRKSRNDEADETKAANEAMWQAISDVALGRSPKPTPSGSSASS